MRAGAFERVTRFDPNHRGAIEHLQRSRRGGLMPIEGPLKELGIHDVFQLLDLSRKSGVLRVFSEERDNEGAVYFDAGAVVAATMKSNPHLLGTILERSGKATAADLARATAMQRAGDKRRVGEILVAHGIVTPRDIDRFMRQQIETVVFDLMSWSEGFFSFSDEALRPIRKDTAVKVSTESLLMEGARRIDEWSRMMDRVPDSAVVPPSRRSRGRPAVVHRSSAARVGGAESGGRRCGSPPHRSRARDQRIRCGENDIRNDCDGADSGRRFGRRWRECVKKRGRFSPRCWATPTSPHCWWIRGELISPARTLTPTGTKSAARLALRSRESARRSGRAMLHLELGAWKSLVIETSDATIALAPASGETVVLIAASSEEPHGLVRRILARSGIRAEQWLAGAQR